MNTLRGKYREDEAPEDLRFQSFRNLSCRRESRSQNKLVINPRRYHKLPIYCPDPSLVIAERFNREGYQSLARLSQSLSGRSVHLRGALLCLANAARKCQETSGVHDYSLLHFFCTRAFSMPQLSRHTAPFDGGRQICLGDT